jgi:hypothetical protein
MTSAAAPHCVQIPGHVPTVMLRNKQTSFENSDALKLRPRAVKGSEDQTLLDILKHM